MNESNEKSRTRALLSFSFPASRDEVIALARRLGRDIALVADRLDREEDEFQRDLSIDEQTYTAKREATLSALATKQGQLDILVGFLNSPLAAFYADRVAAAPSASGWRSPARPMLALTGRRR